jgi:hypothetical protein
MRFSTRTLAAALLAAVVSAPVYADYSCNGTVVSFGIYHDGGVLVNIGYGPWWLCNTATSATYNGITTDPETCKSWQAQLIAAQRTGTAVGLFVTSLIPRATALRSATG